MIRQNQAHPQIMSDLDDSIKHIIEAAQHQKSKFEKRDKNLMPLEKFNILY